MDRPEFRRELSAFDLDRQRTGPHRDDPSLQVGKKEAAKLLAAIGFKPADDVALFPDKYFVIYRVASRRYGFTDTPCRIMNRSACSGHCRIASSFRFAPSPKP